MPFFIEENATNKLHYSNDDGEAQNRSQKMDCERILWTDYCVFSSLSRLT